MKQYKAYTLSNFLSAPQIRQYLNEEQIRTIKVVGSVLPFKVNNYVLDELIDWGNFESSPLYHLTFPQKGMLSQEHYAAAEQLVFGNVDLKQKRIMIHKIRKDLNPHPADQGKNIPVLDGILLNGVQHKYRETMLFFPGHGQTCHAYCTFCFRWPQFVHLDAYRFTSNEIDLLIDYLRKNPQVTDIVFTGGDPMIMKSEVLNTYISALLDANIENLQTIRIGTKALTYWPYKFLEEDEDSDNILRILEGVVRRGKSLSIMAHFNCPRELETSAAERAIVRIRNTGTIVRTQAPLMKHINDSARAWIDMWNIQVRRGCVPYYMFVARDTGAQDYFAVELARAFDIYSEAIQSVSGLAKTARGPSMSASPGKVNITGIEKVAGEKVFILRFLQARDPSLINRTFFAKFDPSAIWLDQLKPAFGEERFIFEE
jgi:L-lysine 2,3-aminomutase